MRWLIVSATVLWSTVATADQIYLCRAYNGGSFWSDQHCNKSNAMIDRIATVGAGNFRDQVAQAEGQMHQRRHAAANEQQQFTVAQTCAKLASEKRQIESRYTNWQWQPPEVINPDQKRQRGIDAQLRQLRCPIQ